MAVRMGHDDLRVVDLAAELRTNFQVLFQQVFVAAQGVKPPTCAYRQVIFLTARDIFIESLSVGRFIHIVVHTGFADDAEFSVEVEFILALGVINAFFSDADRQVPHHKFLPHMVEGDCSAAHGH